MKKKTNQRISLFLVCCMLFTLLPGQVFATTEVEEHAAPVEAPLVFVDEPNVAYEPELEEEASSYTRSSSPESEQFFDEAARLVADTWCDGFFGEIVFVIGEPYMWVDGVQHEIDPLGQVSPAVVDGEVLIPLCVLVEETGGTVYVDMIAESIMIEDDSMIEMEFDANVFYIDGEVQYVDLAPVIMNESVMLSVDDAIFEELGFEVNWEPEAEQITLTRAFQTRRLIVRTEAEEDFTNLGATTILHAQNNVAFLQFETRQEAQDAHDWLVGRENVIWVQPDRFLPLSIQPVEEMVAPLALDSNDIDPWWGRERVGVHAYAEFLYNNGRDQSVIVAVIDLGIHLHHPALLDENGVSRVIRRYCFAGVGSDFPFPYDSGNHGTPVAGVIVDSMPNLNVQLLDGRIWRQGQGTGAFWSNVANAVRWATRYGANVINISSGAEVQEPGYILCQLTYDSIQDAINAGVIVVGIAHNWGSDVAYIFPSHIPEIITVAATDHNDQPVDGWPTGDPRGTGWGSPVDIAAPGVNIRTTVASDRWQNGHGTSLSAPFVAAAAAMYILENPDASPAYIKAALQGYADVPPDGWASDRYGAGILNMANAIPTEINTWDALRAAVNEAPANVRTRIRISNNLTTNGAANPNAIVIPADKIIVLDSPSANRNVNMSIFGQRHFVVYGQLTLGAGVTLHGNVGMSNGGVQVNAGGTFTMLDNSVIQGVHRPWSNPEGSSAVRLVGSGTSEETRATFIMRGGTIQGNTTDRGAGVFAGVNADFIMYGGVIRENQASGAEGVRAGSGVLVEGGTFTMRGGSIVNNTAAARGGGILLDRGTVRIEGGEISNNSAGNGGGVHVVERAGNMLTMTGGVMRNNRATAGDGGGGAIFAGTTLTEDPLPANSLPMLYISDGVTFAGNTAAGGRFTPPANAGTATQILARSSSVPGTNHPLNNYDINFRGTPMPVHHPITWEIGNGAWPNDFTPQLTVEDGGTILLPPEPVREDGFTFDRWSIALPMDHVTAAQTITAIWIPADVHTWDQLRTAVNAAPAHELTTIRVFNNLTTTGAANPNAIEIPADRIIVLESNDARIVRNIELLTSGQQHFIVNGQLTLRNGITLHNSQWSNAGGIQVNAGGTLRMQNGSEIRGIPPRSSGGAVVLAGSGASEDTRARLIIEGGRIQNNSTTGVRVGSYADAVLYWGRIGGNRYVHTGGGVVVMHRGTFTMWGGMIDGNHATFGGGVYLHSGGIFTMSGGSITSNSVWLEGGGVHVGGTFIMNSPYAHIIGNFVTEPEGSGGGIFNFGGTVRIEAGVIGRNTAPRGGGVHVTGHLPGVVGFTMTGGFLSNNRATAGDGGAIFAGSSTANPLPPNSYRVLDIQAGAVFTGNTASGGSFLPPINAVEATRIWTTSSSVPGTNHPLNNYDISFRGLPIIPSAETWDDLREAVNNAPVNELYTIQISNNLATTGALNSNAIVIPADRNIVLESSETGTNRNIDMLTSNQRHFTINGQLTLGNGITLRGGETALNTNNAGGVQVNADGTLTMLDNSTIQWVNRTSISGGAVHLFGFATFIMEGGAIQNNAAVNGGGVLVPGNADFIMQGGVIRENRATAPASLGSGGGIFQSGGTVRIAAGEINSNTASNGGGVHVATQMPNAFTMTGGALRNNRATAGDGGAIFAGTSTLTGEWLPWESLPMLEIHDGVVFEGNTASAGWAAPPTNAYWATQIRTTSSSVAELNHPLNNYDINFRGLSAPGVHTWNELRTAVNNAPMNEPYVIHISSDLTTIGAMPPGSIVIPPGRNIVLESNVATETHNLDMLTNGQRHFVVNGQLTLGNGITLRGGTAATNSNNAGGVQVNAGGTLIMLDNSTIQWVNRTGTILDNLGGAVHLFGSATFMMEGGTIQNNAADRGGGVFARSNANFMMHGGVIRENRATGTMPVSGGGGVFMMDMSTFTMIGGTIEENTALNGGGVRLQSGMFIMHGGEIRENRAIGAGLANGGGGVFMDSGTFAMTDGAIEDNTAHRGGGVRVQGGTFWMDGVTARIDGNTATGLMLMGGGGGIFQAGNGIVHIIAGEINNNTASFGGGMRIEGTAQNVLTMTGGAITNNSATGGVGGAIFADVFNLPENQWLLPVNLFRIPVICVDVVFSGNTAAAGWIIRQVNPTIAERIRTTSSSVGEVNHPLNNYDINFR